MITLKTNMNVYQHIVQLEEQISKLKQLQEQNLPKEQLDIKLGDMNQILYQNIFNNFQTFDDYSKGELLYALEDYISDWKYVEEPVTSENISNNLMELAQEGTQGYYIYDVDNKMLIDLAENNTREEMLNKELEDTEEIIKGIIKHDINNYTDEYEKPSYSISNRIQDLKSCIYMEKAFDYHITNELSSLADNMEHKYNIREEIIENIDSDNLSIGHLKIMANEIANSLGKENIYVEEEIVNDLESDYKQIQDKQEER